MNTLSLLLIYKSISYLQWSLYESPTRPLLSVRDKDDKYEVTQ